MLFRARGLLILAATFIVFIPPVSFTTDNAAMIAITGYFKYLKGDFCAIDEVPYSRVTQKL